MLKLSKDHAATHDENRLKMCLFCLKKKNKMIPISGVLKENIEKLVTYDECDERLPSVVCDACRILIYREIKKELSLRTLKLRDYSNFKVMDPNTRSKIDKTCECTLCDLSRKPGHENFLVNPVNKKLKKCSKCRSDLVVGKPHFCNKNSNHVDHLVTHIDEDLSTKHKEQLVSKLIKTLVNSKSEPKNELSISQERGRPMRVTLKPSKSKEQNPISADDVSKKRNGSWNIEKKNWFNDISLKSCY